MNKLGASASDRNGHDWPGDSHIMIHHQNNMSTYRVAPNWRNLHLTSGGMSVTTAAY